MPLASSLHYLSPSWGVAASSPQSDAQQSYSGKTRIHMVKTSPPALIGTASENRNLENEQDYRTTVIGSKNLVCFISMW